MNTPPPSNTGRRNFFSRLFSERVLKRLIFAAVCLITLIALIYAVEDFRGKRAWNQFKQEWEAKGEKFDLASFVPPPVPDDQNFAMTPLFLPTFQYEPGTNGVRWLDTNGLARLQRLSIYRSDGKQDETTPTFSSLEKNHLNDLAAWQKYYQGGTNFPQPQKIGTAAEDVLTALGRFDAEMSELRAAAVRPHARFPIHYDQSPAFGILLPHLAHMKSLTQIFGLHAMAQMELKRGDEALKDLQVAFRISDSIRDEPFLIDHLVRIGSLTIDLTVLREGLAQHTWNDAQLAQLQKYLASLDIIAEAKTNMRGERSLNLSGIEYYHGLGFGARPAELMYADNNGGAQSPPAYINTISILPGGLFYQNMLAIARMHQEFTLAALDEKQHRVFPKVSGGLPGALARTKTTPYNIFAKLLMPAFANSGRKSARCQTYVDAAQVACALERYRLAQGHWPDALDALVPRFIEKIPTDVMDGKPLRYKKISTDSYELYSIGWNQIDDGGVTASAKSRTSGRDEEKVTSDEKAGDWVWLMPAK